MAEVRAEMQESQEKKEVKKTTRDEEKEVKQLSQEEVEARARVVVNQLRQRQEANAANLSEGEAKNQFEEISRLQKRLQEFGLSSQEQVVLQKQLARALGFLQDKMMPSVPKEEANLEKSQEKLKETIASYPIVTFAQAMLGKDAAKDMGFDENATLADLVFAAQALQEDAPVEEIARLESFGKSLKEAAQYLAGQNLPAYETGKGQKVLVDLYNTGEMITATAAGQNVHPENILTWQMLQEKGASFTQALSVEDRIKMLAFITSGDKDVLPAAYVGKTPLELFGSDGARERKRMAHLSKLLINSLTLGKAGSRVQAEIAKGKRGSLDILRKAVGQKARESILTKAALPREFEQTDIYRQLFGDSSFGDAQKLLGEQVARGLRVLKDRQPDVSLADQIDFVTSVVSNYSFPSGTGGESLAKYSLASTFGNPDTEIVCAVRSYILATVLQQEFGDQVAVTAKNMLIGNPGDIKGHVLLEVATHDGQALRLDASRRDALRFIDLAQAGVDARVLNRILADGKDPMRVFDVLDADMFVNMGDTKEYAEEALRLDGNNIIALLRMASLTTGDEQEALLEKARELVGPDMREQITKENLKNITLKVEKIPDADINDKVDNIINAIDANNLTVAEQEIHDMIFGYGLRGRAASITPEDMVTTDSGQAVIAPGGVPLPPGWRTHWTQWERFWKDDTVVAATGRKRGEHIREIVQQIMRDETDRLALGAIRDAPVPESLMNWIAFFNSTDRSNRYQYAEEVITRVVFEPFNVPTGDYHIQGLYAGSQLEKLATIVQLIDDKRINGIDGLDTALDIASLPGAPSASRADKENKGLELRQLQTAAQYYFQMNKVIASGQNEQYTQFASQFNAAYFELAKKLQGVGAVKRAYELALRKPIERKGAIDNINLAEVHDLAKHILEGENDRNTLGQPISAGGDVLLEGFGGHGNLAEWEIERALFMGESMLNVEFRSIEAESIGGINPIHPIASTPNEYGRRLLDWYKSFAGRFGVGLEEGGVHYMTRIAENFATAIDRRYSWIKRASKLKLTSFGNVSVKDREIKGLFGVHGVWDGYRLDVGILDQSMITRGGAFAFYNSKGEKVTDPNDKDYNKSKSLMELFGKGTILYELVGEDKAKQIYNELLGGRSPLHSDKERKRFYTSLTENGKIKELKKFHMGDFINAAKMVKTEKGLERMNQLLDEIYSPVIKRISRNIGPLISSGSINHPNLFYLRKMLWERAADLNPGVMASMITNLQVKGEEEPDPKDRRKMRAAKISRDSLEAILNRHLEVGYTNSEEISEDKNREGLLELPVWKAIVRELALQNEVRLKDATGGPPVDPRYQGGTLDKVTPLNLAIIAQNVAALNIPKHPTPAGLPLAPNITAPEVESLLNEIIKAGRGYAESFSVIRFPFAAFLDDASFEGAAYKAMGDAFFKRRGGGDLSGFIKAQGALTQLVGSISTLEPDKVAELIHTVTAEAGGILGFEAAQDNTTYPLLESYDQMSEEYWWAENIPFVSNVLKIGASVVEKPMSLLQEYGGSEATHMSKYERGNFMNTNLKLGNLRKAGHGVLKMGDTYFTEIWDDIYLDIRKRRGVGIITLLFRLLGETFLQLTANLSLGTLKTGVKSGVTGK